MVIMMMMVMMIVMVMTLTMMRMKTRKECFDEKLLCSQNSHIVCQYRVVCSATRNNSKRYVSDIYLKFQCQVTHFKSSQVVVKTMILVVMMFMMINNVDNMMVTTLTKHSPSTKVPFSQMREKLQQVGGRVLLVSKHPKEEEVALFMKFIWRKSSCSGEPGNEVSGIRTPDQRLVGLKRHATIVGTPCLYFCHRSFDH